MASKLVIRMRTPFGNIRMNVASDETFKVFGEKIIDEFKSEVTKYGISLGDFVYYVEDDKIPLTVLGSQ